MMRQLVYSMIREKFHAPLLEVKGACTTSIARLYRTRELIKCVVHFAVDPNSLSLTLSLSLSLGGQKYSLLRRL